jgi:hypothetical protein
MPNLLVQSMSNHQRLIAIASVTVKVKSEIGRAGRLGDDEHMGRMVAAGNFLIARGAAGERRSRGAEPPNHPMSIRRRFNSD